jgi:SPP1 gp7 family putative phage head morphogenesis protein
MPSGGNKTPIEQSVVQSASGQRPNYGVAGASATYSVSGTATAWMSPGPGLAPLADFPGSGTRGRQFDFPVNVNLIPRPRTYEAVTFQQLRDLAENCDILRTVIENEKDNLARLKWKIKPKDEKAQPDTRCQQLTDFFSMPDKEHTWDEWLRMLLDDLFVLDAPCLYPRKTKGGDIAPSGTVSDWYGFEIMDGATIKRFIDPTGRTPLPPDPAYQGILKGMQAVDYTRDELIYRPRNVRSYKIYGYSPVEQILMTVNIAIRRSLNQLSYYTEGNVPDLLFGVPDTWQPDQIKQFQTWWDSLTSGQSKKVGRFIPGGIAPHDTKPLALKDDYDEWLARVICYAFSTQPSPFIKQMNRATAQTSQEEAQQEGLLPRMNWVRNLLNYIIWKYFGFTDLEFDWDQEEAMDPLVAEQIIDLQVKNGTKSVDEIRQANGDAPIGMGCAVYTATGPISVVDFDKQQEEQRQQASDAAAASATAMANGTHPSQQPPNGEGAPNANANGEKSTGAAPKGEQAPSAKHAHGDLEKKKSVKGTDPDSKWAVAGAKAMKPVLAKFLKAQAPKIAAQLSKSLGLSKAEDDPKHRANTAVDSINFSDWTDLPPLLADSLVTVAVAGGSDALDQLGLFSDETKKLMTQNASEWASNRAAEMVGMKWVDDELVPNPDAQWQITEGTREMLRSLTTQATEEGWGASEFANAIQESTAFSDSRAETIARTESAFADTHGNIEGWKASGVVESKQFLAAPDCCDECQEIDGEVVGLDDTFSDGSDGSPLHPRCRCATLPVLSDESATDGE